MFSIILASCSKSSNRATQAESTPTVASGSPSPAASPTPSKRSQAQPIHKTWATKYTFETRTIERKHEGLRGYEISVDYPLIKKANTPSTRHFNKWMLRKVHGYVHQFEGLERKAEIHDKKRKLKKVEIDESLEIGYLIYFSDAGFISLRLTHAVMALGQMHPIDYYETINYDLKKQHALSEGEVFRAGYLKAFAQYARTELKNQYALDDQWANDWLKGGTKPKQSNFKNWNIVPDGILLSFEDYQIGPHAFGQPEIIIPFERLKRTIRSGSVAARFVKM